MVRVEEKTHANEFQLGFNSRAMLRISNIWVKIKCSETLSAIL